MSKETELELAERHVREGEANVAGQRGVVSLLNSVGQSTGRAERLLFSFELKLAASRDHLIRLRAADVSNRSRIDKTYD